MRMLTNSATKGDTDMSVDTGNKPSRMGTRKNPIAFGKNANYISTGRSDDSDRETESAEFSALVATM